MARRIEEQRRTGGRRARRPVIYIICEGAETEINYFRRFRTRYSNVDIRPIPSKHKSATRLVDHAENVIKNEPYYPGDGDRIWCVFDRNSNTNEELKKAEQKAARRDYSLAFSNPAFELWFLLHYTDQQGYLEDGSAVIAKLDTSEFIPGYSKSEDYFDMLLPNLQRAIDRAVALQKRHVGNGLSLFHRDSNPCTTVAQLVDLLQTRARQI